MSSYSKIISDGLWNNNPILVQILGLCPLLAVTNNVTNALGLGIATILVVTGSNTAISCIRKIVHPAVRLPIFVMIIAAFTTCAELLIQAYAYTLYTKIGIFIPLIVTNCMILGRAEAFASRNNVLKSLIDGLITGLGFAWVLILLGSIRELIGSGTLFANAHLILGDIALSWQINVLDNYDGFIFAILPPGAFISLGLIIATKKAVDNSYQVWLQKNNKLIVGEKRVRVTDSK